MAGELIRSLTGLGKSQDSPNYLLCHRPGVISLSLLDPKKGVLSTKRHILMGQHISQDKGFVFKYLMSYVGTVAAVLIVRVKADML